MSRLTQQIKDDPQYKAACKRVKRRDGYQCQACGSEDDLTVDHIVALANGGDPLDEANMQTLCRSCNGRKSDNIIIRLPYHDPAWLDRI